MSYTYLYIDPSRNEPIYVGKGKGNRAWKHLNRKDVHPFTHRLQKMKREGIEPVIVFLCDDVDDELACLCEEMAIEKYGRKDLSKGTLLNLTDGGDGGANPSPETRVKISAISRNRSPETLAKIGAASRNRSPETLAKLRAAATGVAPSQETRDKISAGNRGKVVSEEARARIGAAHKGKFVSEETRAKLGAARKGKGVAHTEETKAKIAVANSRRIVSEETRAKIGTASKLRAARKKTCQQ